MMEHLVAWLIILIVAIALLLSFKWMRRAIQKIHKLLEDKGYREGGE